MAHFRRKHPKEGVVQRNGEWSHPPIEKGRYKFSSVATKRRANSANHNKLEWDDGDPSYPERGPRGLPLNEPT